jgi:hypothetical protein
MADSSCPSSQAPRDLFVSVNVAKKRLKRGANLFSRSEELMHGNWLKPLLDG